MFHGEASGSKFMPQTPTRKVSGMKITETMVRKLMMSLVRAWRQRQMHLDQAGQHVALRLDQFDQPHRMVERVVEEDLGFGVDIGHFGADQRRQARRAAATARPSARLVPRRNSCSCRICCFCGAFIISSSMPSIDLARRPRPAGNSCRRWRRSAHRRDSRRRASAGDWASGSRCACAPGSNGSPSRSWKVTTKFSPKNTAICS